jgi:peptidoglycan/LPS O-acetylase OafA/YrhL
LAAPNKIRTLPAPAVLKTAAPVQTAVQNLPALTGVRALAASMVFWHHYLPPVLLVGAFWHSFFREGHAGVSLFFVLSGFLIYYRHSGPDALNRGPLVRYAVHRFARVYPMYFLIVVGMAMLGWAYDPKQQNVGLFLWTLFSQLTFIRGFSDQFKFIGVGQGWTLTTEATFYVLFPFLLWLIRPLGFAITLFTVYAVGLTLWAVGELLCYHDYFRPFQFVLFYTFFGRAWDFFAGMMVAEYVKKRAAVAQKGKPWGAFPLFTLLGLLGIFGCLSAQALMETGTDANPGWTTPSLLVFIGLMPVAVSAFYYGLVTERSWVAWLLKTRVMVALGAASYTFYLIHVGGPFAVINRLVWTFHYIGGFLALQFLAYMLWKCVEEPLREWIVGGWRRTQP